MRFEQALTLAGLRPRDVVADGRWRRCATDDKPMKRNGSYKLAVGGARGWWRNWALDSDLNVWDDDTSVPVRKVDEAAMRARRDRDRAGRIVAMRRAREYWRRARPLNRPHPYLEQKGLSPFGCAGLREHDGLLVVPVWHGEWIISVQTIHPDGTKRFAAGAPVKAGCYVIEREHAAVTAFAEGLATGLAVFQAMRQARVVVCFDAGNLLPVVQRLRPRGTVVIAADNDHATAARLGFNPGREKAQQAATLIGCGVAWPEGIVGTDWADAAKEWGRPQSDRRIERLILKGARYVEADTS